MFGRRLIFIAILWCCYPLSVQANDHRVSLQRGASLFMSYCSGCHSLKYMPSAPIEIALPPEDAKQWFGVVPPDLSFVVRERGARWLFLYLTGFYKDASRPFGVNNHLVPGVSMPNVLGSFGQSNSTSIQKDLVTFLAYVSEPELEVRHQMGWFVLGFLLIFLCIALALKNVYWQKKHPKRLKMW
jgi:ubiquinol-cytochrome c reductase cytochrome c1 subunit